MQLSVSRHISHVTLTHISHHRDNIFPVALGLAAAGLQHLVQGCWGMWAAWPGITQWPTAHLLQLCICNVTTRDPGIVFSLFYGPIVHLSQQLTHCLCVARLLGHCLLSVRARALSSLMKCFVTGNSAVNVLRAGPESRLPSSARPDCALGACV